MILTSDLSDDYFKINLVNRCKVIKHVKDNGTGIEAEYNLGICLMSNPQITRSNEDKKLSVDFVDLMKMYDGTFSGSLEQSVTISVGANLSQTIQAIATNADLMNLSTDQILIESNDLTVPYDVTVDSASNITDLLKALMDLYMGYELFFNQDGLLVYRQVKDYSTDLVIEELINSPLIKSYEVTKNLENVKNHIVVLGGTNTDDEDEPYQYRGESKLDDGSELSIGIIGERKLVISNDDNASDTACQSQSDYELQQYTNYATTCEMTMVSNYRLIPNKVIELEYTDDENGLNIESSRWLINTVDFDLKTGNLMTLDCSKQYNSKA
ncbi:MAG TPA: hypothetical protein DCW51_02230 [Clostridium sp.]|nr:hypothetical protein [Clostridium sp.]